MADGNSEEPGLVVNIATLLIVGGAGYFFWYAPMQERKAETEARAAQAEVSHQEAASTTASDRVCRSRGFPSCDAARNVYFQWRNQLGLHSFEERCRHANATRFLDDSCGGPGDFRVR